MKIADNSTETIWTRILSNPSLASTSSVETPLSVLYRIVKDDPGPWKDEALRTTDIAGGRRVLCAGKESRHRRMTLSLIYSHVKTAKIIDSQSVCLA